jgi:hypothetical protein
MLEKVKGDAEKEAVAHKFAENQIPLLDAASSPRVIKTHLPFSILPPDLAHTGKVFSTYSTLYSVISYNDKIFCFIL